MTQCQCDELIAGSSNTVRLVNLTDDSGDHRADATVSVTIKIYSSGATVTGASAVSMAYVAADEEYKGVVPYTASLVAGTKYKVQVTAVLPASAGQRTFEVIKVAE